MTFFYIFTIHGRGIIKTKCMNNNFLLIHFILLNVNFLRAMKFLSIILVICALIYSVNLIFWKFIELLIAK